MMRQQETYTAKGTIKNETAKAVLFEIDGDEYWIPLSQIFKVVRTKSKGEDEIVMSEWIAKEKGLI
jgi:chemotaxis signal transduction protein